VYTHILLPTDGSPLSGKAIDQALKLAKHLGAKVTALAVTEPYRVFAHETDQCAYTAAEYEAQVVQRMQRYRATVKDKAAAIAVPCDTLQLEHEQPYQAIIDAADANGCDLIAMASHGRRGLSAVVLGSVTANVLLHSKTPVLIYR